MRWQTPSERTQLILMSPIILPIAAAGIVLFVVGSPLWWPLHKYYQHLDAKGWHPWFAWRPVYYDGFMAGQPSKWIWLETVERCVPYNGRNAYRPAQAIEAGTGETPKSGSTAKPRKRGPKAAPKSTEN